MARSKNRRTREFKKLYDDLSSRIQHVANEAFKKFKKDPYAPELHNHAIGDSRQGQHFDGTRSVWINYRYRSLYVEDSESDTNVWYWIGSHEDYNDYIGGN